MAIVASAQGDLIANRVPIAVAEVNSINAQIVALGVKLNTFNTAIDAKIATLTSQIDDLTGDIPDLQALDGGDVQDYITEDIAIAQALLAKQTSKKTSLEARKVAKAASIAAKISTLDDEKDVLLLELYGPVLASPYTNGLFYNFTTYTGVDFDEDWLVV